MTNANIRTTQPTVPFQISKKNILIVEASIPKCSDRNTTRRLIDFGFYNDDILLRHSIRNYYNSSYIYCCLFNNTKTCHRIKKKE